MKYKHLFVVSLLIILVTCQLHAAEFSRYLKHNLVENGLNQSLVNTTIQDNDGYLWVATNYGLSRYDGYTFEKIAGPNNVFSADGVMYISLLSNNQIFVSTYLSGAYLLNAKTLKVQQVFSGTLDPDNKNIVCADFAVKIDDSLWMAIDEQLVEYNLNTKTLASRYALAHHGHIIRALMPHNKSIYLATTLGLKLFDVKSGHVRDLEHLPSGVEKTSNNSNVKSLLLHDSLGLLVGTVNGLYSFNIEDNIATETLVPDLNIWKIVLLKSKLYFGTQLGLFSLDVQSKKLTHVVKFSDVDPLITNNTIRHIFLDKSGLFWLSSQSQGIFTFDAKTTRFQSFSDISHLKLSNTVVHDYVEQTPGVYWIATGDGLNKLDTVADSVTVYFSTSNDELQPEVHNILKIFPQQNGKFWLWHNRGLTLFNPLTNQVEGSRLTGSLNQQLLELRPHGIQMISSGRFLFTAGRGHYVLDLQTQDIKALSRLNDKFNPENSLTFMPSFSGDNHALLVTNGQLVNYNIAQDTYQIIFTIEGLNVHNYTYVTGWHKSEDGHLWLSVNGFGVVELDSEYNIIREFTEKQGLNDVRVWGLNESASGDIWVSAQTGFFSVNKDSGEIQYHLVQQGLLHDEIYSVSKTFSNGEMAFSTATGLVYFDPLNAEQEPKLSMPVQILSVGVASIESVFPFYQLSNMPLELNYNDYGIDIKFSTFNFSEQADISYQIKLQGQSLVTYENFSKNSIEFTKLTPGDYEFSIRAKSTVDDKLGQPASFKFRVNYNAYQSPMSYTLYALFTLTLFIVFYMRRVRQQFIIQKAHDQVLQEKQRADLALSASNSGIWSYNKTTGLAFQNRLKELGHDVSSSMPMERFLTFIHPDDGEELTKLWLLFITGELKQWDVSYRIKNDEGNWVWFRDLGKASVTNHRRKTDHFTGTYTNVTATKSTEMQAELYGQALRKMNEWLLILDNKLAPVTSNASFNKRFLRDGEQLSARATQQVLNPKRMAKYLDRISELELDQKFISEDVVSVPAGFDIPVLISISAIGGKKVENYVIVISDMSAQKKVENELKYLASYDSLTDLANRALITGRVDQLISQENGQGFSLLFVDLDRFKQVNDVHGHSIGDQVLIDVARRMNDVVGQEHCVGRQSGDEFIILLNGVSSFDALSRYADRINNCIAQPYLLSNQTIHISSSIGIARYPDDALNSEDLIQNADIAMLHAKHQGRNCYRFFTEEMNVEIKRRVLLEDCFVQAIADNQLTNYYQPIVNLDVYDVGGVELLLRWFNGKDMISPATFIPLAENIGKIIKITELALEKALIELKTWLVGDRYLSINLSAIHINQEQMIDGLLTILSRANVSPKQIRLEITEGVLIEDTENAKRQLTKLKNAGFQLFLDDFGTGYSSLTYISQFPIDVIKIDQCFIKNVTSDLKSRAIVQTIASLAQNINSYCVVEGVEELSQVKVVKELGCNHIQGYYFAKPMPISKLLSDEVIQDIKQKLDNVRQ